ncbi:MoaD/ThiS family protein [Arthrobacter sp. USHLN218]|uniref:MoaD/ThiS family protein n=1 Tax=Arthrobacter sp. USHLN218 TaxID=3081232 RepID=UPI003015E97F
MAEEEARAVTVVVPSLLAKVMDDQRELQVGLEDPATVAGVLDRLAADYPVFGRRVRNELGDLRRYVNLYVDGEDIRVLDGTGTHLRPGQELLIIQSVAGG